VLTVRAATAADGDAIGRIQVETGAPPIRG